jgi:hypothetical protein
MANSLNDMLWIRRAILVLAQPACRGWRWRDRLRMRTRHTSAATTRQHCGCTMLQLGPRPRRTPQQRNPPNLSHLGYNSPRKLLI